jgi:hypothetical protein
MSGGGRFERREFELYSNGRRVQRHGTDPHIRVLRTNNKSQAHKQTHRAFHKTLLTQSCVVALLFKTWDVWPTNVSVCVCGCENFLRRQNLA